MTKRIVDCILVSFTKVNDKDKPDNGILVVGRKPHGRATEVINAFEGKEAEELYKKLITKK